MIPSIDAVIMRLKSPGIIVLILCCVRVVAWQICHRTMAISLRHHLKTDGCVTWLAFIDVANLPRATYPTYSYVPRDKGEIL